MASSSSSHPAFSSSKYDVFISFRGEDTRGDFISHLHDALCRNNIETYIDYRLEKGEYVWPSLEKAIQDSILFLIVFSENYGTSTWCLKELTKILECSEEEGHHAIPVFYKINPSDIRKQKGSYETAFTKHEQSNPKEQVDEWRDALTQAANLSGWDSSTYRNEAKFIQDIVDDVLARLDLMDQSDYSDGLVGVHKQMTQVESILKWTKESKDVRFIGIWGMGSREEFDKFGIVHLPLKSLPLTFSAENLVELRMPYSGMTELWTGVQNVVNLKEINLYGSKHLKKLPDFSKAINLKRVYLSYCTSISEVHPSILSLNKLESLKMLHLNDCCNIFEVVDHISLCSSLETLRIEESSLESLPESIKYFSSLQELELKKCKRLWFLPQLPPSLKSLLVLDCSSLKTVQFTSSVVGVAEVEGSNGSKFLTRFQSCLRLDQHSVKAIVANAMVKFNKILSTSTSLNKKDRDFDYISRVIYSGSRVPEWFKCKTPHASITVDLSSAPLSIYWGLLYCIVASPSPASENIWIVCEDNIKISDDEKVDEGNDDDDDAIDDEEWSLKRWSCSWRVDIRNFTSNHVYLWCDGALSSRIHRIKECRGAKCS